MLRRTQQRLIIPFQHGFVPGGRPSERGMLYRNNNINAHCRVSSIQNAQKTHKEGKIFLMLMVPDQIFFSVSLFGAALAGWLVLWRSQPFSFNTHKHKWIQGGLTEHEMYQRNREMDVILTKHREETAEARSKFSTPAVLQPPADAAMGQWKSTL